MRRLLDTHVLRWALTTPERLAPAIRDELEVPANIVLFSAASIWEIAIPPRAGGFSAIPDPGERGDAGERGS